jgi:7,8-dihydroneopterin aldolase/epimerase/oxygenase
MYTIELQDLKFYCYHGVFPEEKLLGNNFIVNACIEFDFDEKITELDQTLNYQTLYEAITKRMQQPTPLLETIAYDLLYIIKDIHQNIYSVAITIAKLQPPISCFEGQVKVSFKKVFK